MTHESIPQPENSDGIQPLWETQKRIDLAKRYNRLRTELGADVRLMLAIDSIMERDRPAIFRPPRRKIQPPIILPSGSGFTTQPEEVTALHLRGIAEVDHAS